MRHDHVQMLTVDDITMHVRTICHTNHPKENILMIMGFMGNFRWWPEDLLTYLARHHRVIIFDNRGVGETTRGKKTYSLGTLANDVCHLMDKLHLKHAVILGVSMGGMVALEFAIRYPDRIRKLIVANSMRELKLKTIWKRDYLKNAKFYTSSHRLRQAPLYFSLLFTYGFLHKCPEEQWQPILRRLTENPISPKTSLAQIHSILTWKRNAKDFHKIECPTLVFSGEKDQICPPRSAHEFVENIWDVRHITVKGQGHAMFYEILDDLLPYFDQFLAS